MQPTPDAQRHFEYSTSFRRHGGVSNSQNTAFESIRSAVIEEGPSGIWDRLVGLTKGVRYGSTPEENGYELASKVDQTPSAKYSGYDAEVRFSTNTSVRLYEKDVVGRRCQVRNLQYPWLDCIYYPFPSRELRLQRILGISSGTRPPQVCQIVL
jgi:hypothetical protein